MKKIDEWGIVGSIIFGFVFFPMILQMLSGCSVNSSKLDAKYAKGFVNKMTYTKDTRTGLCYAMVASRKTWDANSSGLGITEVPYSAEVERLIGK